LIFKETFSIKEEYLEFLEAFFALLKLNAKKTTRLAFINADWRNFQNKPVEEKNIRCYKQVCDHPEPGGIGDKISAKNALMSIFRPGYFTN